MNLLSRWCRDNCRWKSCANQINIVVVAYSDLNFQWGSKNRTELDTVSLNLHISWLPVSLSYTQLTFLYLTVEKQISNYSRGCIPEPGSVPFLRFGYFKKSEFWFGSVYELHPINLYNDSNTKVVRNQNILFKVYYQSLLLNYTKQGY